MNEEAFREALITVQARRQEAHLENERRQEEIGRKIPQIAEINSRLAQTASRLIAAGADKEQFEKLRKENLEAQALSTKLLEENGYPADYLDIHYHCEKCHDTGYTRDTYCDCLKAEVAAAAVRQMNRKAKLALCTFDDFSLEYYRGRETEDGEDCYRLMESVLHFCRHYADEFTTASPSVLLYGQTGVGKTHLSLSIVTEVLRAGYNVVYDSVINLLGDAEREHFRRSGTEETLPMLLETDLLVMDDLGTEMESAFNTSTVYNIINTRLNRGLPTIISTNLKFLEMKERYEERIVSRLFGMYRTLELEGVDVRIARKTAQYRAERNE